MPKFFDDLHTQWIKSELAVLCIVRELFLFHSLHALVLSFNFAHTRSLSFNYSCYIPTKTKYISHSNSSSR
jgi:hypothetical protein